MMIIQKMKIIQKLLVWFFCFAILSQNEVESPVLCLESDGHMNIEIRCDTACKVPIQKNDGYQNTCDDCIDISFWNYNPDLTFLVKSFGSIINDVDLKQESNFHEVILNYCLDYKPVEYLRYDLNTYLINSILLI